MAQSLIPAGRRAGILSEIKKRGFIGVDELSERFDVSVITIRRDLDLLEKEGALVRTHGGAVKSRTLTAEASYKEKDSVRQTIKAAIGDKAAELAKAGDTVFVNSGSTTFHVIRALSSIAGIKIVTNNIRAALEAENSSGAEIILIGGRYRKHTGCTVGDFAASLIERLNVSKTFIGADGITLKNGITSPSSEEAAITRMMIERTCGPVVVAADASKIGCVTAFFIAPVQKIDYLITDSAFDKELRDEFEQSGITIIKAETAGC